MKITRYSGLIIGLLLFVTFSLFAQLGGINNEAGWILGYLRNSAFLLNFTSFLIPAVISSVLFPNGGMVDVYMIVGFSIIEFALIGFILGKVLESKE